jgi:phage baseplate assembly protein W
MSKDTINIDFDIFNNDSVSDQTSDADRLVDNSIVIPSDDQILARTPFLSVSLPVDKNSTNASFDGYKMIRGYENLVKQNFKNLMLTSPGEKIMDPKFGVGLRRYLFEQDTLALRSSIEGRVYSQTKKYLPYINIREIKLSEIKDDNKLSVYISYFINPLNMQVVFNYSGNTINQLGGKGGF